MIRLEDEDDGSLSEDLKADNSRVLETACEFWLTGPVTDAVSKELTIAMFKQMHLRRKKRVKPVYLLHINSGGGAVTAGFAIASAIQRIRAEGFEFHTLVSGHAASMGFVIAQFGSRRLMDALALAHIHDVSFGHFGNTHELADTLIMIEKLRQYSANVYAQRNTEGHNDPRWWLETYFKRADHFFDAESALALGLVDEIVGGFPTPAAPPQE